MIVPKIIEEMTEQGVRGEFFQPNLIQFGYNESIAHEYYPLSKQEADSLGYSRQSNNYDPTIPPETETILGNDISKDISFDESLSKKIIVCKESNRPFRLTIQEILFYKKHNLLLPGIHPDHRHKIRMSLCPKRSLT